MSTCKNYIACDDFTKSEIVVPVFSRSHHTEPCRTSGEKRLVAVLDIDSDVLAAFDAVDDEWLTRLVDTFLSD